MHYLTNVKIDISKREILALLVDQPTSCLGKTNFPIQMKIKKCIYLMKQSRTFSLTLYYTRLSFVMIVIPLGSRIPKFKIWPRKNSPKLQWKLQWNSTILKTAEPSESPNCHNWRIKTTVLFLTLEWVNGSHCKPDRHTGQYWKCF